MKIRFAGLVNLASTRIKRASAAFLFLLLAIAVPQICGAQERPKNAGAAQPQSNSAPLPKTAKPAGAATTSAGNKAGETVVPGAITDIKVDSNSSKLAVTVSTNRPLGPQEFLLEEPARLVLDFPNTRNRVPFSQLQVRTGAVRRVRVQQFQTVPSPIARVVFDLNEAYGKHELEAGKDGIRLVFYEDKLKPQAAAPAPKPATPPQASPARPPKSSASAAVSATPPEMPMPAPAREAKTAAAARQVKTPAPAAKAEPVYNPPPKVELPKSAPMPEIKSPAAAPARIEVAVNQQPLPPAPGQTPRVAAVASSAAPPKPITPGTTRFSGQPLTLDLIDFPLVDFFRLMSEEGGINVVMDPEIKGRISIKVVKVPWDQIFDAVLTNNGLDKQVDGSVVRIARKSTLQEEARQQESLKKANLLAADLETRIKRLNYAKANSLVKALEDQKTVRGTIVVEERSNSLILTDLPGSIDKLVELIDVLDVPQPQVEIEARIVSATRDFARDIGIQFGFVDGNLQRVTVGGPNTFGTIGGTRPSATPTSTYAAGNPITGRGASDDSSSESAAVSTGTSSSNKGNYNVNLPATKAFGGLGISIGNIFDTFLLDAAITAGESKGSAKLISQPKVTAQNNSPAVITQGLRFPVQVIANNTISVQFQNAALTLTVTPQITYEGNIVLDLKVENNTPDFGRHVNGIPSIRTSESTTRVLVSDGGTTVIGGILIDDEATQEDKVPGLGSLPVIGNLFRRNSVARSTQEVLFFVTPRIIK